MKGRATHRRTRIVARGNLPRKRRRNLPIVAFFLEYFGLAAIERVGGLDHFLAANQLLPVSDVLLSIQSDERSGIRVGTDGRRCIL